MKLFKIFATNEQFCDFRYGKTVTAGQYLSGTISYPKDESAKKVVSIYYNLKLQEAEWKTNRI